jgi:catechol 2,3-dioxygenase-like lactoylglutathione lyase family enzyme
MEPHMKPRITVITLGVDDLDASLRFYGEGLGFPTEGIVGREFEHGAAAAGAVIVKAAHDTFWGGYSGYFQDPDGHLWEVVWNPQWSE